MMPLFSFLALAMASLNDPSKKRTPAGLSCAVVVNEMANRAISKYFMILKFKRPKSKVQRWIKNQPSAAFLRICEKSIFIRVADSISEL
jgi:hypothetical protein